MNGYLYIATGDEHVQEAITSVNSLRRYEPYAKVQIITEKVRSDLSHFFDEVVVKPGLDGIEYKVQYMAPVFQNTCFVDTDTYFVASVRHVFEALQVWDMAMMLDPVEVEMSPGTTAFNTGVIFMRQSDELNRCLGLMRSYYFTRRELLNSHPARKQKTDQPFMMKALEDSKLKVLPLASNYNFRYRFPVSIMGKASIIHGPKPDVGWDSLAAKINETSEARVWTRSMVPCVAGQ